MQSVIVFIIVALSAAYLIWQAVKSWRQKQSKHCAGCGKE